MQQYLCVASAYLSMNYQTDPVLLHMQQYLCLPKAYQSIKYQKYKQYRECDML